LEELRKELSEKQELLVQAAKALDLLEEQHQEESRRHAEEKAALDNRIQDLEKVWLSWHILKAFLPVSRVGRVLILALLCRKSMTMN